MTARKAPAPAPRPSTGSRDPQPFPPFQECRPCRPSTRRPKPSASPCRGSNAPWPSAAVTARPPWTFMRQQKSRCDARYVSSMSCLLWLARSAARLAGSERFSHGSHDRADAQLLSGRFPTVVRRIRPPIPLAAGTAFRRRDPSTGRRLSALSMVGHSPPGPAPAASGRTGTVRSRDQASLAPVGTRPVSQNRQRAMSSLRASATTITRRIRPRPPAVRSSNHLLSALSG